MSLPDVLVIGPMRTGTTWIYEYLLARGDVCLPNGVKETFFFDRNYGKGLEWYKAHFHYCNPGRHRRIVEVAPSYFHSRDAPHRIRETMNEVCFVAILRDPVARSWSHYLHLLSYGYTQAAFHEAVREFPEILDASRYATHLKRWRNLFPGRVYVLFFEELGSNREEYCRRLCNVLQLEYRKPVLCGGRSNPGTAPFSPWLARAGRTMANALRSRRLYFIINAAKAVGLKCLFFGHSERNLPKPGDEDLAWLVKQLESEVRTLQSEFSESVSAWRSFGS